MKSENKSNQSVQESILSETLALNMANMLKGLADPTRLRLLSVLFGGEACVNDLADKLGMTQSAISHQLRVLRDLKFVSYRRDGQQVFYGIDDEHIGELFQRAMEHAEHQ